MRSGDRPGPPLAVAAILLVAAVLLACQGGDAGAGNDSSVEWAARDSAGARIVDVRLPADPPGIRVTSPEPEIVIGSGSDETPYLFTYVTAVAELSDGAVALAEYGSREVRIFGPEGDFRVAMGGDGDGPSEFRWPSFVGHLPPDTLVIHDMALRKIALFATDGRFLGSFRLPGADRFIQPRVGGLFGDGGVASWGIIDPTIRDGLQAFEMSLGRTDLRTRERTEIAVARSSQEASSRHPEGLLQSRVRPFAPTSDFAAAADVLYVLESTDPGTIRVYGSRGDLRASIRVEAPTPVLDDARVDDWIDDNLPRFGGDDPERRNAVREQLREDARDFPPPERLPLFRSLEATTDGNVCAERYPLPGDTGSTYWCFSPRGEFDGGFRLPSGLLRRTSAPEHDPGFVIGAHHVLGVWTDDLDMHQVRRYRLHDAGISIPSGEHP